MRDFYVINDNLRDNYENNQQIALYRLIYYSKFFSLCCKTLYRWVMRDFYVINDNLRDNYENNQQIALYRLIYYSKFFLSAVKLCIGGL